MLVYFVWLFVGLFVCVIGLAWFVFHVLFVSLLFAAGDSFRQCIP